MALPCDTPPKNKVLQDVLNAAARVRNVFAQKRALGSPTFEDARTCWAVAHDSLQWITIAQARPGMVAYAQAELDDGALDFAAEATAYRTQVEGFETWISGAWPSDAFSVDSVGRTTARAMTGPESTAFFSHLDDVLATLP